MDMYKRDGTKRTAGMTETDDICRGPAGAAWGGTADTEGFYSGLQILEREENRLTKEERLEALVRPLLAWYEKHARVLPWREDPEPYRVWISEIMLQQTRVEAVKPYFERFMEQLPDIEALASVEEDQLLKLWEGLGYYNRARNLKKTAQIILSEYGGKLPSSAGELLKLPGIGSYTAGAIASIAYGAAVPAVDGNVLRVMSRVLGDRDDILKQSVKRRMEEALLPVIPKEAASAFNQGLIEIGAIVCVPNGAPLCGTCPFESVCTAKRQGLIGQIPYKAPKKARRVEEKTVLILAFENRVAIRKRDETGLLASLYELPNLDGFPDAGEIAERFGVAESAVIPLEDAKHVFSHVEWHMKGFRMELPEKVSGDFLWVTAEELRNRYSLPNAFKMYTKLIR